MKYSLTITGLFATIALPLLVSIGFSEACANEIVLFAAALPGLLMAYIGRVRQGDVNLIGAKR